MKIIIEIDGVVSTRHTYNVWSVVEYKDGIVGKDTRAFTSDSKEEFLAYLSNLPPEMIEPPQD